MAQKSAKELEAMLFDSIVSLVMETNPDITPNARLMIQAKTLSILKAARKLLGKTVKDIGPAGFSAFARALGLAVVYAQKAEQLALAYPRTRQRLQYFLHGEPLPVEEVSQMIDDHKA